MRRLLEQIRRVLGVHVVLAEDLEEDGARARHLLDGALHFPVGLHLQPTQELKANLANPTIRRF